MNSIHAVVNNLISNDWHFGLCGSICIKVPSIPVTTFIMCSHVRLTWRLRTWMASPLMFLVFVQHKASFKYNRTTSALIGEMNWTIRPLPFTQCPLIDWSHKEDLIDVAWTSTVWQTTPHTHRGVFSQINYNVNNMEGEKNNIAPAWSIYCLGFKAIMCDVTCIEFIQMLGVSAWVHQ